MALTGAETTFIRYLSRAGMSERHMSRAWGVRSSTQQLGAGFKACRIPPHDQVSALLTLGRHFYIRYIIQT